MDTPTIFLDHTVAGTYTNIEGAKLYAALAPHLAAGTVVRLSLRNATPMSSSFLNSSIGDLMDHYGLDKLRHCLRLVDYLPSHAAAIKKYMTDVASLEVA